MAGYYGFTLVVPVSVRQSVVRPSVFSFLGNNLSESEWIFTRLGMCIDIVEIWFGVANGQIPSIFDRVICPGHIYILFFRRYRVNINEFSPNLVYALILWRSAEREGLQRVEALGHQPS